MTDHNLSAKFQAKAQMAASASVVRGSESWTYFYFVAAFMVAIEGTMASMIEPLPWWGRELLFICVAGITIWVILFTGWCQNILIKLKTSYEQKAR